MRIKICSPEKKLNLLLPNFLLKTSFAAKTIFGTEDPEKIEANRRLLKRAYKALKQYKKKHGKLELVNVVTANGQTVVQVIV